MEKNDKKLKSDLILDKLKGTTKKFEQVQVDEDTVQIIIISLDGNVYAVEAENVFEIFPNQKIYSVPGTPSYVLGVQNLRGDITSILSLKVLLNLADRDDGSGLRVVYTKIEEDIVGFLVDMVNDVIDFPISGIIKTLSTLDKQMKDFIQGEIFYDEQHIPLLNIMKIFDKAARGMNKSASMTL
ncbi:chemotaxis protein CheW [candidate division CSSED10-310 bacterium]|uniref:Chemotaxis protein CheW n=1 Tax=candidate division CSSED10-310 bacterium TaxID=2855610 RepID=A0ABV6Z586_UNCC1